MIKQKKQIIYKANRIGIIELIFLIVILIIFLLPAAQQMVKFYLFLAMGIFFVGAYTVITGEQYGVKMFIGASGIAILFYILGDAKNIIEIISKLYYYFITCFPALLLFWFLPRSNEKQRKIIMIFATGVYLFVLGNTYKELLINENATRLLAETLKSNADNVGTYDFVYASGALIPFLGICFSEIQKKWKKVIVLMALVLELYFLLIAQYTIALMAAIISLVMVSVMKEKRALFKFFYVCMLIFAFCLLSPVLVYIASKVPSEQMAIRLLEVADFMGSGNADGYNLSGRMNLYGQALQAFLTHPLTGNRVLDFDSHSTILAVMARLGIWGMSIYVWMLYKMKKKTELVLGIKKDKWRFTPIFAYLMIMALTNPIHSALITNAMVWFVIPLGISMIRGEKANDSMEN